MTVNKEIRIVVVDDSQTARELLVALYESAGFRVVGVGKNGEDALQLVVKHKPNIVSMDVVMPKMDGLEATRAIMREHPTPIVIVTASLMRADTDLAFEALKAGALTAVQKPGIEDPETCDKLIETMRLMASVSVIRRWSENKPRETRQDGLSVLPEGKGVRLIGIASSTGGPGVLAQILKPLPRHFPIPIIIVQHVTNGFALGLAEWLHEQMNLDVMLAGHGDIPKAGLVLLPPDDYHLQVSKSGSIELSKAPPYKGLRPSANYLFNSMARFYGASGMGIILTGMGDDGAEGMEAMRKTGALTFAQDEESCVVYGMPLEAVKRKAIKQSLTPDQISQYLMGMAAQRETTT
jgi:two-component system chemotaxis response regulator CheB